MRKYSVTSPRFPGELIFGYDTEGVLKYYENNAQLEPQHIEWLYGQFPLTVGDLERIVTKGTITDITDLSFDAFWEAFAYKVSRKDAEKAWRGLGENDKANAIAGIKRYNYYLQTHKSIERLHPATYLNKRRFEDKF
jgi:hypothetical protein